MRITVTGGAGFIGSHLVDRLLAAKHEVVVLDDFSTGKRANLPGDSAGLHVIEGDVADPEAAAAAVAGSDAVFHLAAVASVQASIDDPVAAHHANLLGTLTMLEAAKRAATAERARAAERAQAEAAERPEATTPAAARPFIYASSAAVYGDARALPIGEDTPKAPLSPYAIDKLAGEHYLAHYHRRGELSGVAFRFFNVYGPRQDPSSPYSGVISIFLERAAAGEPLTVYGDGAQSRDFVFVQDVVDQLVAALAHPRRSELPSYNVGTGRATSLQQLLAVVRELVGPLEVRHAPARPGDIRHSLAGVARLQAMDVELGVPAPATPLRAGLTTLLPGGTRSAGRTAAQ